MKKSMVFIAFSICMIAASLEASAEECEISLQIFGKQIWTLKVESKRVFGNNNVLNREGDVAFGFVNGQPTRLKIYEDWLNGSLGDKSAVFHYSRDAEYIEISGLANQYRFSAVLTADLITFRDQILTLHLTRITSSDPLRKVFIDNTGYIRLTIAACSWPMITSRPELILLLHQAILPRVERFEDIMTLGTIK